MNSLPDLEPLKNYNPEMHTTEHILNKTMDLLFNCGRAVNAHIEKKKSKCDYKFHRDLTEQEIELINLRVNSIIESNLEVSEKYYQKSEVLDDFDLSRVPDNEMELIRIIAVGDYDYCPCIGHHVKNTSEIGKFKILSTDYNGELLRIRFKLLECD